MSWAIKQTGDAHVLVLDSEMGIQHATDFYQAVLPLACNDGAVRVDARAVKSIHSSIMQILHALSHAVPDFGVTEASVEFHAAESRVGLSFIRSQMGVTTANQTSTA